MHPPQVGLPGQNHHVGQPGVKLHRFEIGDVYLRRHVHLHAPIAGLQDHRQVGGDDRRNAGHPGRLKNMPHQFRFIVKDFGVEGQVTLHSVGGGRGGDPGHVGQGEVVGRPRPHVKMFHPEIDRARPSLDGRPQRLIGPDRGHDLYLSFIFHQRLSDLQR